MCGSVLGMRESRMCVCGEAGVSGGLFTVTEIVTPWMTFARDRIFEMPYAVGNVDALRGCAGTCARAYGFMLQGLCRQTVGQYLCTLVGILEEWAGILMVALRHETASTSMDIDMADSR